MAYMHASAIQRLKSSSHSTQEGNKRRKTETTDANATSSRSHAVLSVVVTKREKLGYEKQTLQGKLTLVDLAGSERASETRNRGQQLKDSANINT